jgi:hypothetical protein
MGYNGSGFLPETVLLNLSFAKIPSTLKTLKFLSRGGRLSIYDRNPLLQRKLA